jgi:hypothetical protein
MLAVGCCLLLAVGGWHGVIRHFFVLADGAYGIKA